MARTTKNQLEVRITELEARCAALEARLTIAKDVYRSQRARIGELEATLNTRGTKPAVVASAPVAAAPVRTAPTRVAPIITHFVRRDGVTCERTRIGNRAVVRELHAEPSVPGIEVTYS